MNAMKLLKAAVGIVVLLLLAGLVMNWVGDYRDATKKDSGANAEATTTPAADGQNGTEAETPASDQESTQKSTSSAKILVVSVDGLNFRTEPSGQAKAIRGLKKGEKVTLLATQGNWYKIRDAKKVIGYITSDPAYTDSAK